MSLKRCKLRGSLLAVTDIQKVAHGLSIGTKFGDFEYPERRNGRYFTEFGTLGANYVTVVEVTIYHMQQNVAQRIYISAYTMI